MWTCRCNLDIFPLILITRSIDLVILLSFHSDALTAIQIPSCYPFNDLIKYFLTIESTLIGMCLHYIEAELLPCC